LKATEAAKHQGAIHALRYTASLALSQFSAIPRDIAQAEAMLWHRKSKTGRNAHRGKSQRRFQQNGLKRIMGTHSEGDQHQETITPANLYPQKNLL